jgi:hypothetical protein
MTPGLDDRRLPWLIAGAVLLAVADWGSTWSLIGETAEGPAMQPG